MPIKFAVPLVAALASLFVHELSAAPCAGFTDVDSTNPFCTEVTWVKNRGITLGCTATQYCPNSAVTRLQMAAFLYRQGNVTAQVDGNAIGGPLRIGTIDIQPVQIIAAGTNALRIEPNGASPNLIAGDASFVTQGAFAGTVSGGGSNAFVVVDGRSCGQGCGNHVADSAGTVAGGISNGAGSLNGNPSDAQAATVGGGFDNKSTAVGATVSGGLTNRASGPRAAVAGGVDNVASGDSSAVAGGRDNQATGGFGFVAGGFSNRAVGGYSFAAGRTARADQHGCLVLADGSSANPTSCFASNEVVVRGVGGFYFWTAGNSDATYSGARLAQGTGGWAAYSDVNGKEAFAPVDPQDILERVARLKVGAWQWKHEPGDVRHIGPTAQDFHAAFAVGGSDKHIVTVDADGVALAAIQGVNQKLEMRLAEKDAQTAALKSELERLQESVAALRSTLAELVRRLPAHDR